MPQDAEAIVRRWFEEVWNQGREETIDELFASEAIRPGLGESEAPIQGPKQFKPFFRNMRATFPDLHTGRKVHVPGMIITQVSGGKITGAHNIWDQHGMSRQLGLSPKAEAESKDRCFGDAMPGA
jgi:SnoaL-like polyketide cyclase